MCLGEKFWKQYIHVFQGKRLKSLRIPLNNTIQYYQNEKIQIHITMNSNSMLNAKVAGH